jgi:hypothetical protein
MSLCTYKPTLLVFVVPALLFGRRFRSFLGFVAGAFALSLLSLLTVGSQGCLAYISTLKHVGKVVSGGAANPILNLYVDFYALSRALSGDRPWLATVSFALMFAAAAVLAAHAAGRGRKGDGSAKLWWAWVIACTLVFNVYVPIYDSILIVLSSILALDALWSAADAGARLFALPVLQLMIVALYLAALTSRVLWAVWHFQFLTVVLTMMAIVLARFLLRSAHWPAEASAGRL